MTLTAVSQSRKATENGRSLRRIREEEEEEGEGEAWRDKEGEGWRKEGE